MKYTCMNPNSQRTNDVDETEFSQFIAMYPGFKEKFIEAQFCPKCFIYANLRDISISQIKKGQYRINETKVVSETKVDEIISNHLDGIIEHILINVGLCPNCSDNCMGLNVSSTMQLKDMMKGMIREVFQ